MNKKEIAKIIEEIGKILELKGENPFKVRAYYNGARIIETLDKDIYKLVETGEISEIKGIGKALADKITTLVTQNELPYYEELKSSIPGGLLDLLKIPGLGVKKVKTIYEKLKISTIGELEYACRENRLRDLEGFGQKSQDKILQSIALHKKYSERFLYPAAAEEADLLLDYLKKNNNIDQVEVAGSLRRKMETIKDIDVIASCKDDYRQSIMQYFTDYKHCMQVTSQGLTKSAIVLDSGIAAEIRLVNNDEFPFLLNHATGSKDFNTHTRRLAKDKKMKLNEYGLFKDEKRLACKNEQEIFEKLGLPFISPELREDMGEIEAAQKGSEFELYDGTPFYGLFHIHSRYSDGANTIAEIVAACKSMNFEYAGICDHSKSAFYANGLSEEKIKEQHQEIDQLNAKNKSFKIFKGIEVDILADGTLDYGDEVLASFDFVIISVHSSFGLSEKEMTTRICKALLNPFVTMLGHPTGRLLLAREPYAVNMEEVIDVAADQGKAIEINANPFRLDLDWRWGKLAQTKGIKTALNPDAHSIDGLNDYKYGIGIARKGWFKKENILNTFTSKQLTAFFNTKK
jgi:DNA polymerase (family 10)